MEFKKVERTEEYCEVCGTSTSHKSGCEIDFIMVMDGTNSTFICEECAEGIASEVNAW